MMKTKLLFDQDPYLKTCDAKVAALSDVEGKIGVELDQTIFYPASGGQSCDLGTINNILVLEVFEDGHRIIHILEDSISKNESVTCAINWGRRFDHMQQHTGQHILSQAFHQIVNGKTIGFHLGTEKSTIDLNVSSLDSDIVQKVENLVNDIVFQNREVNVHEVTKEEALKMPLRKPPTDQDLIRVLEINDFDWTGCCGTHVRRSGEVGIVKVSRADNYKSGSRVTFLCGMRAVRDYQKKSQLVNTVSQSLTAGEDEIVDILRKWKEERRQLKLRLKTLLKSALKTEAQQANENAEIVGRYRCFTLLFKDRDPSEVQSLIKIIIQSPDAIVFAGIQNERGFLFFGRSENVDVDIRPLMEMACAAISGRGGGSPAVAQGNGEKAAEIPSAIEKIKEYFIKTLPNGFSS